MIAVILIVVTCCGHFVADCTWCTIVIRTLGYKVIAGKVFSIENSRGKLKTSAELVHIAIVILIVTCGHVPSLTYQSSISSWMRL